MRTALKLGAGLALLALVAVFGAFAVERLYRAGRLQFNHPSPGEYPVSGIDVSHHQGAIDWPRVSASGVSFAFIKATEGRDHVDRRFAINWREAGLAGVPRGAYHFFTFCTPGTDQAAHFLRVAPPSPGTLPPVVDVEFGGNCTSWTSLVKVRKDLARFLGRVESAWGTQVVLYATREGYKKVVRYERHGRPLWIRSIFWEPRQRSFGGWEIWQFTGAGRIPGISGPVDRNVLNGAGGLAGLRRSPAPP